MRREFKIHFPKVDTQIIAREARFCELATFIGEHGAERGTVVHRERFLRQLDKYACPRERHLSVGSFAMERPHGYARYRIGKWWCPDVILEPEMDTLIEAREATLEILSMLEYENIAMRYVRVRFSGNKSFHILIPSFFIGSPVCIDPESLWILHKRLFVEQCEYPLDLNLLDPRHLVRIPRSIHPETGLYVTEMRADHMREMTLPSIVDLARLPQARVRNSPGETRSVQSIREKAIRTSSFYIGRMSSYLGRDFIGGDPELDEIERSGADQGSRNTWAIRIACRYLARNPQEAQEAFERWCDRCRPPLHRSERRAVFRSAQRYIRN